MAKSAGVGTSLENECKIGTGGGFDLVRAEGESKLFVCILSIMSKT